MAVRPVMAGQLPSPGKSNRNFSKNQTDQAQIGERQTTECSVFQGGDALSLVPGVGKRLLQNNPEAGEPLISGVGGRGEAEGDGFGAVAVVDGEAFGLEGDDAGGGLPGGEDGGGFDGVVDAVDAVSIARGAAGISGVAFANASVGEKKIVGDQGVRGQLRGGVAGLIGGVTDGGEFEEVVETIEVGIGEGVAVGQGETGDPLRVALGGLPR